MHNQHSYTYTVRLSDPISYSVGVMTEVDSEHLIWCFGAVSTNKKTQTELITFKHSNSTGEFKR